MKTVLLVDDDARVRKLLTSFLEMQGFRVFSAADGPAALNIHRENCGAVTLLVTDIEMPRMSGLDLASAAVMEHPGLPVLLVSGQALDAGQANVAAQNGWKFLQKPLDLEQLACNAREMIAAYPR